ncbi:MAG: hypothetical protein LBH43_01440 [Treponema sp.]|jgi:hypothetical protein|nr:hypothetical protein [Treponema sp.]
MTLILYKNTQIEGEKPSDIYRDLWQLFPYEPVSLFASGFTSEQAEYVIPDGYNIIKHEGKNYLQKANYLYEIFTNPAGKPGIRILNGGTVCKELLKQGEEQREELGPVKQNNTAWVPQMINGEWEIY